MGDRGRGEEPKLARAHSARSEDALERLSELNVQLTGKEKLFGDLVAEAATAPPNDALIRIKNQLAVMSGEIDKLQMKGIDSVLVGELSTGKDEARDLRKDLNRRAELLGSRVKALHKEIVNHLS